jgi:8-oxo-dGTP pyrophosphatase MutT (NUDIX family)
MSDDAELIPAATVLLLRDGDDGLEVLMVRRNSTIAFGGMWVFPGGRVDDDDEHDHDDHHLAAARRAAAREVREETGLCVDNESLIDWSYWVPPPMPVMARKGPVRRFSTWFFAVDAPGGDVAIDHGEIHDDEWLVPSRALDKHRAGEIELAPPTWVTLWQLGRHDKVAQALDWARTNPSREFRTRPLRRKPLTLAWAGDAAYDDAGRHQAVLLASPGTGNQTGAKPPDLVAIPGPRNRLTMLPDGWLYEFEP